MADGRVEFEIVGNDKSINSTIKNVTANIEKESKKWDASVDESTGNMESSFSTFLKGVAKGFAAAGIGKMLLDIGKDAIAAASDLQEVQNVVDVTFGDSAGRIESWAKSAGKQYGLTETAAKRYTSTIGAMLKSQGMADDEIVQTSTDLAGLAADMASFYNLDFETAFQKIRSGISGETEPLKQLGINMSAANLEAFRLEKGINTAYSAMSKGEQTALRYQYIMQATADAQGDFARTADGFANASRRVETAMETIKTVGGGLLLEVIEPLASGLADILNTLTSEDLTVLDEFTNIDKTTGQKVSGIQRTADDARYMADELDRLGAKTEKTEEEQRLWLETCKRLTQTIPGLSSIINAETGEINGGTEAVKEYVKAWEEGQKKLAYMKAHEAKKNALDEAFSDIPRLELDALLAESRTADLWNNGVKSIFEKYGFSLGFDSKTGKIQRDQFRSATREERKLLNEWADLWDEYGKSQNLYSDRKEAYDKAMSLFLEEEEFLNTLPGKVENLATATAEWATDQKNAGQAVIESIKALEDYVIAVHDATEQTVNGIVKGFEVIERPTSEMEAKRSKLIEQQNELNRSTKEGEQKYQELQKQIDALNESMNQYSPKGMEDALQSQLAFMDEYIKNLEEAKRLGLSDELLASLSDGSVESAEYLTQLVANPEQAKEVDALYQQVQAKKSEFTDALTEQKLTVDETYQAMVDTAKQALADLNMKGEAKASLSETVQGIADGINDKTGEVQKSVDAIIAQLNRLSGLNISLNFGSITTPTMGGSTNIPSHETGLDFVPFDNYLASLHEGEGILTAEENRIWQRFKNGAQPQTMDYDALGATMRDNVKAGGNVYLDGRTVGRVISAQQGADYRALKRSGWQS